MFMKRGIVMKNSKEVDPVIKDMAKEIGFMLYELNYDDLDLIHCIVSRIIKETKERG